MIENGVGTAERLFQFQTGAIKRGKRPRSDYKTEFVFQFQTGAIKSLMFIENAVIGFKVSIPNWCD